MSAQDRIVLLQKQLSIAIKALKDIRDNGISWTVAESALDEIERIKLTQEGRSLTCPYSSVPNPTFAAT